MKDVERELLVNRICSGLTMLKFNGDTYYLRGPTAEERYKASIVYQEACQECADEVLSNEDIMEVLLKYEMWSEDNQKVLEQLEKDIDELKIGIFQKRFRKAELNLGRKALDAARKEYERLSLAKHQLDCHSASGLAAITKIKYIVGCCLLDKNKNQVWNSDSFLRDRNNLIEEIVNVANRDKITDYQIRELSRTEPWRTMWSCRDSEKSLFGSNVSELTDEQKRLIVWSKIHDSIYESEDCPEDFVFDDDDMMDGWMILQKRKQDKLKKERKNTSMMETDNEKIASAGERFILVGSREEAQEVEELNSPEVAMMKKARENLLMKKGIVQEAEMPDSRQKIMQEFMKNRAKP